MYTYTEKKQAATDKKKTDTPRMPSQMRAAAPNVTGIPDPMKTRFENLSGFSFDDVRVHYNSDKPAQLQALAYTRGNQVYVAPGQEKHLGHELGHVVQQKQGRVMPTENIIGIPINDDISYEKEADNLSTPYNSASATYFSSDYTNTVQMQKGLTVGTKIAVIDDRDSDAIKYLPGIISDIDISDEDDCEYRVVLEVDFELYKASYDDYDNTKGTWFPEKSVIPIEGMIPPKRIPKLKSYFPIVEIPINKLVQLPREVQILGSVLQHGILSKRDRAAVGVSASTTKSDHADTIVHYNLISISGDEEKLEKAAKHAVKFPASGVTQIINEADAIVGPAHKFASSFIVLFDAEIFAKDMSEKIDLDLANYEIANERFFRQSIPSRYIKAVLLPGALCAWLAPQIGSRVKILPIETVVKSQGDIIPYEEELASLIVKGISSEFTDNSAVGVHAVRGY